VAVDAFDLDDLLLLGAEKWLALYVSLALPLFQYRYDHGALRKKAFATAALRTTETAVGRWRQTATMKGSAVPLLANCPKERWSKFARKPRAVCRSGQARSAATP
jgi:hypothetical protein